MLSEFGMREVSPSILSCVTTHLTRQLKEGRVHLSHRVKIQPILSQALKQQQPEVAGYVVSIVREQRWVSAGVQLSPFY